MWQEVDTGMKMVKCSSTVMAFSVAVILLSGCVVARERPAEVVISEPPPAGPVEVVPVAPGPDYVWVGGYWAWRGRWAWEPP